MNRRTHRPLSTLVAAGLTAVLLVGCSDDTGGTGDTAAGPAPTVAASAPEQTDAPAAAGARVTIDGGVFQIPSSVAAGSTVTVANTGGADHTFSEVGGLFSVGVSGGQEGTFTAPAAGSYQVVCLIHSSMTGTLVVD